MPQHVTHSSPLYTQDYEAYVFRETRKRDVVYEAYNYMCTKGTRVYTRVQFGVYVLSGCLALYGFLFFQDCFMDNVTKLQPPYIYSQHLNYIDFSG